MEKKSNKLTSFINKRILYRVSKEEKKYVKTHIMETDHNAFRGVLIVIFILQIVMILYKLISKQNNLNERDIYYLICYTALATCCVISFFLTEYLFNKKKENIYFVVVAIMIDIFFLWALSISCLDSFRSTDLTTYAYSTVALVAIVVLEPWIFILDSLVWCTALCLCINFIPSLKMYPSVIISAASIGIIISIISVVNFNRRVASILLQKEVIELNSVLNKQSHVDSLTGINNRLFLTEHIDDALNLGITPSGVMMFDIDDFKQINDEYGHQTGDSCLQTLGSLINDFLKEHNNSYAVRYGGEEFLIFIPRTDRMKLLNEAEEFRKKVENTIIKTNDNNELKITISIGIALAKTGQNYSGLINKADTCLYSAKKKGKNKVCFE